MLNGTKSRRHGEAADAFLLTARVAGSDEIACSSVPRDSAGLSVSGYPTMDGLRAADVKLADVAVPADALVGQPATAALDRACRTASRRCAPRPPAPWKS